MNLFSVNSLSALIASLMRAGMVGGEYYSLSSESGSSDSYDRSSDSHDGDFWVSSSESHESSDSHDGDFWVSSSESHDSRDYHGGNHGDFWVSSSENDYNHDGWYWTDYYYKDGNSYYHKPDYHSSSSSSESHEYYEPAKCHANSKATIAEVACGGSYSELCKAIKKVGLYNRLDDWHGTFTAFFPTNNAFHELLDFLNMDEVKDIPSHTLKEVILFHVHSGSEKYQSNLKHRCSDTLRMANGDDTRTICSNHKNELYQKGGGNPGDDKPRIIKFDREACNGVIHTVDEVILPGHMAAKPKSACMSITDIVCEDMDFDILCEALHFTDLDDDLDSGSWTLFAPTDDSFHELMNRFNLHNIKDMGKEKLKEVLLYHAVSAKKLQFNDLDCDKSLGMASGENSKTQCIANNGHKYQTGTCNKKKNHDVPRIIQKNVKACNGYIQVVEDVLLPKNICDDNGTKQATQPAPVDAPKPDLFPWSYNCEDPRSLDSIAEFACAQPSFSTLCDALIITGLDTVLSTVGTFTVFAPTNKAFEKLGAKVLGELLADPMGELYKILLYHVADGLYYDLNLKCGLELESLIGSSGKYNGDYTTTVCNQNGKYQVGNGNFIGMRPLIIEKDIDNCNGVIHAVDNVLIPGN